MNKDLLSFIPGCVQGVSSITVSYPFHVLKVHMQKYDMGIVNAFRRIYDQNGRDGRNVRNGMKSFYRGSFILYSMMPLTKGVEFAFVEKYNNKYNPYLSGAIVGSVSSIYNVPQYFITTNMAIDKRHTILSLLRENKHKIYKGYGVEYTRTLVGASLNIGTYMTLRNNIKDADVQVQLSPFFGSFAYTVSATTTFPLEVIRTEKQTTELSYKQIIQNKYKLGIHSFYRGLLPSIARSAPTSAIGMFTYEYTRRLLGLSH